MDGNSKGEDLGVSISTVRQMQFSFDSGGHRHHLEGQVLAPSLEGRPPSQHLVDDAPEGPEVGGVGQGLVVEDLGSTGG